MDLGIYSLMVATLIFGVVLGGFMKEGDKNGTS
jgi:hypothetical protein